MNIDEQVDTKLTLKAIHPSLSPAFSPNLHSWMRGKRKLFENGAVDVTVFRIKAGSLFAERYGDYPAATLMIGYVHDGDFVGARLMRVLGVGNEASSACFVGCGDSMEVLPDFWQNYRRIGRCAIDPDHEISFHGDRYQVAGEIRECLWCAARHQIETQTVMVPKTVTTYRPI